MKKTLTIVLSLVLVLCLAVPAFAANKDTTATYKLDLEGRTNVLSGLKDVTLYSVKTTSSSGCAILTDGVYVADVGSSAAGAEGTSVFLNKAIYGKNDAAPAESDGIRNYSFAGVTGSYYYYIEAAGIANAKVDEFACYFTCNTAVANNDYEFPFTQIDSSFDILVSCDGGKTYEVAWSSVDMVLDKNAAASSACTKAAGMTKAEGGNATLVNVMGGAETNNGLTRSFRVINEKLNKTYENVTNVVYAAKELRRNSKVSQITPAYYCARMSEFVLFEAEATPAPATADTAIYYVVAAVITSGAVLTIAKKKKEN